MRKKFSIFFTLIIVAVFFAGCARSTSDLPTYENYDETDSQQISEEAPDVDVPEIQPPEVPELPSLAVENVTIDEVINAALNPDEWVIIDVRTESEFNGERTASSVRAFGTGRIKGAVHVEWLWLTDDDGRRLPEPELREIFSFIGDRNVIVYCQSGNRATYPLTILRDLGFHAWIYGGSWIDWSYVASTASDLPGDIVLELTELWTDNGGVILA